ncbi:MAG: ABC transporter ATP-binding protein [Peptococcaceae bacterium]
MLYEIAELNFAYGKKKVLRDLDFSLEKDEFVTIIGPNGSGKTTLLQILTGLLKDYTGEAYFNGIPLKKYRIKELSRKIAVIPQDIHIRFPFSCLEIVMMGRTPYKKRLKELSGEDLHIIYESMERTGVMQFADALITEISGGERQRVILARALAQTPQVLFLDEAFSAMDIFYNIKSLNILKSLVKEKKISVIAVMHDLNLADLYSDKIIALDQGRMVSWGTTEKVMKPDFINTLFKINVSKLGEKGLAVLPDL